MIQKFCISANLDYIETYRHEVLAHACSMGLFFVISEVDQKVKSFKNKELGGFFFGKSFGSSQGRIHNLLYQGFLHAGHACLKFLQVRSIPKACGICLSASFLKEFFKN